MLRIIALFGCLLATGCAALPERVHQPTLHNPFPQISRVGVAPFFNLSTEKTLDGRKVAEAYAAELAEVPGCDVISVSVVETAAHAYQLDMNRESDARRLAQLLDIDAVVTGAVTEYSPYYPPRLTLKVAWYAANPNFHPIPAGYGLPWGTAAERDIPGPLAFQAELALAKEQLKTQTPPYQKMPLKEPGDPSGGSNAPSAPGALPPSPQGESGPIQHSTRYASYQEQAAQPANPSMSPGSPSVKGDRPIFADHEYMAPAKIGTVPQAGGQFPPQWPDAHGFVPRGPTAGPPQGIPSDDPIMQHTKSYRGNDVEFTTALEDYYYSRDDARMGGWQNYLRRSDDFVRFCCRMHIWEMLGARGGSGETRVVWRWSLVR
jgi:hypothetical protein